MATKRMSRTTKGIIAALLGLGLLAGYGTFALWSDSQGVTSGSITAGNLDLSTDGTPAWSDISPPGALGWTGTNVFDPAQVGAAKPIADISKFLMVPGDLLEYQAAFKVIATGTNMKAQLVVAPDSVTIPTELTGHVTIAMSLADSADNPLGTGSLDTPITFAINGPTPDTGAIYNVTLRVGFDGDTTDQSGTNEAVDLSGLKVELKQVRS